MPGAATREGPPPMGTVELDAASRNTVKTSSTRGGLVSRLFPANAQLFQNFQDSTQDPDATPQTQQATAAEASTKADEGIDHVLLAAKCTVPALFVLISGLVAIPLNQGILTEFARVASQEFAGGALIVTFAFELTKSYRIHDEEGELNKWLVICSFLGTLVSAQVQCAAQGMWPFAQRDRAEVTVGDSVPFAIGFVSRRRSPTRAPRLCVLLELTRTRYSVSLSSSMASSSAMMPRRLRTRRRMRASRASSVGTSASAPPSACSRLWSRLTTASTASACTSAST